MVRLSLVPFFSLFFLLASLPFPATGESLYDFLFTSESYPPSLSKTAAVARKEEDRVRNLMNELSGSATLFLPTNAAWAREGRLHEALLAEPEGNVRYDFLLAAAAAAPGGAAADFAALRAFADGQGGVVDSAYGTPYFVRDGRRVCLAEWANGNYVEGACANVVGDPVALADATVYPVDSVLVSHDLREAAQLLMQRRLLL